MSPNSRFLDLQIPARCWKLKRSPTQVAHQDAFSQKERSLRQEKGSQVAGLSSGGVGVFHVKGWRPKSSVCPLKPKEPKLICGISGSLCSDLPGMPEKFEKIVFVLNLSPPFSWQGKHV